jgi:hypothetical protein
MKPRLPPDFTRVLGVAVDGDPRFSSSTERPMLDVIFLIVGVGFFALSIAYVFGCDRL